MAPRLQETTMLASRPVSSLAWSLFENARSAVSISHPKRISGRDNPQFKRFLAARSRKVQGLTLVEGPKLLDEAIRSGLAIRMIALDERAAKVSDSWRTAPIIHLAAPLMKRLVEVETHQGVVALVERPGHDGEWRREAQDFVLILDGVQDPGNVGTLFRTAEAAGVSGVLLTRGCADPFSPKALRASAGSAFRLPYIREVTPDSLLDRLPKGVAIMAAVAEKTSYSAFENAAVGPTALALGSEGSGLSAGLLALAKRKVRIPLAREVESLNVAAAGAILLFEIARRSGRLN
jgi:TrmH family RNA methyltransferase